MSYRIESFSRFSSRGVSRGQHRRSLFKNRGIHLPIHKESTQSNSAGL